MPSGAVERAILVFDGQEDGRPQKVVQPKPSGVWCKMTYEEELQVLRDAGWKEFTPGAHSRASNCFQKRFPGPRCWGNEDKPLSVFVNAYDHRQYGQEHGWGYQVDMQAKPTEGEAWIKFESYGFGGIEHIDEQVEMLLKAWKAIATHKGEENG